MSVLLKEKGTLFTVKYLKRCRLHFTRYLCGSPLMESDGIVDINEFGLPNKLKELKALADGNMQQKKLLMTILLSTRTLKPRKDEEIEIDYSTITNDFTGKSTELNLKIIRKVLINMGIRPQKAPTFKLSNLFMISKSGPHGPSTLTCLKSLWNYNVINVAGIAGITCQKGHKWLTTMIAKMEKPEFCSSTEIKNSIYTRRLSIIKDPECKMRVIAIFDWITQMFLDIISKDIYAILKGLRPDRTFSQNPLFSHIQVSRKNNFYSIDLTAATDRFPIQFQQQVLKLLYGETVAGCWGLTMTGQEFLKPKGDEALIYKVGQPMGARSSWAVFALSHHVLIRYAAYQVGLRKFSHYLVLGDDVVINNNKVAREYKRLLKILGVEASESKTHISSTTYEFAKRWIDINKGEFTGFPIRGIVENFNNNYIVYTNLFDYFQLKGNPYYSSKDLLYSIGEFITSVNKRLLSSMKNKQKKEHLKKRSLFYLSPQKVVRQLYPYSIFMKYRMNLATYDDLRTFLSKIVGNEYQIPCNMEGIRAEFDRLLMHAIVGVAFNIGLKLRKYTQELFNSKEGLDLKKSIDHPLLICLENRFVGFQQLVKKVATRTISLEEVINELTLFDPDAMLKESSGRKIKSMIVMGTIVRKFISETKFEPYQMEPRTASMKLMADFMVQKMGLDAMLKKREFQNEFKDI